MYCRCHYRRNADDGYRAAVRRWQSQPSPETWADYLRQAFRTDQFPFSGEAILMSALANTTVLQPLTLNSTDDGFVTEIRHIDFGRGPYNGLLTVSWDDRISNPNLFLTVELEPSQGSPGGLQTSHYTRYRYLGGPVRSDAEMATALANPDQWEQL